MEISRHWRLRKQRYTLLGEKCPECENPIFPPRDVCPFCERRIGSFPNGNSRADYQTTEINSKVNLQKSV